MNKILKVGDLTKNGWEVVDVRVIPHYTTRKKIKVVDPCSVNSVHKGKTGYFYYSEGSTWVIFDCEPGKKYKLMERELEYC